METKVPTESYGNMIVSLGLLEIACGAFPNVMPKPEVNVKATRIFEILREFNTICSNAHLFQMNMAC